MIPRLDVASLPDSPESIVRPHLVARPNAIDCTNMEG